MRNYFKYYMGLLLLGVLMTMCVSHSPQREEQEETLPENTEFEVSFGGHANGMSTNLLRADDINNIKNLRLLVFDEHRNFLYSRTAIVEGVVEASKDGRNYLPEAGRDGIEKMRKFRVRLLSSLKPRYIHFVANHDWNAFPQDIYLRGKSDGEILGHLSTNTTEFWQIINLDKLQNSSLQGRIVKLLRNTAQVRVEVANKTIFTLTGFVVYNCSDRANVAPFVYDKNSQKYSFPFKPQVATVPAGTTYKQFTDVQGLEPIDLFEHENTNTASTFVIIKGRKTGSSRDGYYKVDFVDVDGNTGVSNLLSIIRNHKYIISIKDVLNEGYPTFEEAVNQPAGNNLFASVELSEYPKVSDGRNTLEVSNLGALYVKEGTFKARILYSAGAEHVKIHHNIKDTDPYLGTPSYNPNAVGSQNPEGSLEIPIKAVPQNGETVTYRLAVVGKDPTTKSTMSRIITISLHRAYDFNAQITTASYYDQTATISFTIPRDINPGVFPFDVYIYTSKLTPKKGGMLLEMDKVSQRYRYKYTVRDASAVNAPIRLEFVQNGGQQHGLVASLESDYFNTQTLNL